VSGVKNPAGEGDATPMNRAARVMWSLVLLAVLAFCVFGFMATFEPLDVSTQVVWRGIYGLTAVACLGGLVVLSLPRKHGH